MNESGFKLQPSPDVTTTCKKCGVTIIVQQAKGIEVRSEYVSKDGFCYRCTFSKPSVKKQQEFNFA